MIAQEDESYGHTPLHVACSLHSYSMAKYLIGVGSNLEAKNLGGFIPA